MKYRPLGNSEINASVIALGAWAIGGWRWGGQDDNESVRTIHAAIDAGITLIDTAPAYGFGHSEEIVGRAIKDRRDEVVIATKCGLRWGIEEGTLFFSSNEHGEITPDGPIHIHKFLGPESIRAEVEQSLARLGVDTIDLMQTHWQDVTTPIADSMGELMRLKDEGKIRAIGVSNANTDQMDEYRAVGPLVCDQERYSMIDRTLDETNRAYCVEHGMTLLAYSPLSHGLLSGKITQDRSYGRGDLRTSHKRFKPEALDEAEALIGALRPIAESKNITLAQLVVAWTIAQPGVTHALVGARRPEQAIENAVAGDVELSDSDLQSIDASVAAHAGAIA
ncbi:MAG: aldo/keto reductase [Pirellulales bacterium]|nr:aldo/keto reductase [Pirellulales bacterium]